MLREAEAAQADNLALLYAHVPTGNILTGECRVKRVHTLLSRMGEFMFFFINVLLLL